MVRNFLKVTIRNIRRNSLYSAINIIGLSTGITCALLILLWVHDEVSYDAFHPKYDRLYQLYVNAEFDGKINSWRSVPLPTYEALKERHSNIQRTAVSDWGSNHLLSVDDKRLMQDGYFVSEEFLEMFEFPLVVGDAQQVLDDPKSIVITETLAKNLFGDADPLGKIIRVNDESSLNVTGILKDLPNNSSFDFDFLMTYDEWQSVSPWVVRNQTNWGNYSFQVYLELFDEKKLSETDAGIADLLTENGQEDIPRYLFLHPLEKWRLYSRFENGKATSGMADYVHLFGAIAGFILLIACINFMNLSTARSEKRAREVGIRKSLGSKRKQLILQFLGESLFMSILATTIAILLTQVLLPFYNQLVDKQLVIGYDKPTFWMGILAIVLLTGVLSGSYPAFYLSSFNPVKTLKGAIKLGKGATTPRQVLVILQFGFAIILLVSTAIIFQQINLVRERELGYDQENLITIPYTDDLAENFQPLKNELLQSGVIESVTRSNSAITNVNSNNFLAWPGKPENLRVLFITIATDYDWAKTMGIKMLHGREFSKEFASDSNAIIINKAALDMMNLDDPIGTNLTLWGEKRPLIGVVENTLMESPHEEIRPLFAIMDPEWINVITVRLSKTRDVSQSLDMIKPIFEKHNPAYPFEYTFVDEAFERKFTTIELTRKLAMIFAGLAILITGLGLLGLAAYMAEQRTKEIGIRKVLGASVPQLILLMSRDFSKLVIISFILATPAAYYLMVNFLSRYTIHVSISWWIFPIAGLIALTFALLIVSQQASKAAQSNPVKSLRNE